ncbi:hypothetical protein C8Q77DRAFT_170322 [Trametes polyzona]|nr:hypothetical protein C8Q77DRAFT_170322 [Trametes polyzona]
MTSRMRARRTSRATCSSSVASFQSSGSESEQSRRTFPLHARLRSVYYRGGVPSTEGLPCDEQVACVRVAALAISSADYTNVAVGNYKSTLVISPRSPSLFTRCVKNTFVEAPYRSAGIILSRPMRRSRRPLPLPVKAVEGTWTARPLFSDLTGSFMTPNHMGHILELILYAASRDTSLPWTDSWRKRLCYPPFLPPYVMISAAHKSARRFQRRHDAKSTEFSLPFFGLEATCRAEYSPLQARSR